MILAEGQGLKDPGSRCLLLALNRNDVNDLVAGYAITCDREHYPDLPEGMTKIVLSFGETNESIVAELNAANSGNGLPPIERRNGGAREPWK